MAKISCSPYQAALKIEPIVVMGLLKFKAVKLSYIPSIVPTSPVLMYPSSATPEAIAPMIKTQIKKIIHLGGIFLPSGLSKGSYTIFESLTYFASY